MTEYQCERRPAGSYCGACGPCLEATTESEWTGWAREVNGDIHKLLVDLEATEQRLLRLERMLANLAKSADELRGRTSYLEGAAGFEVPPKVEVATHPRCGR